MGSRRKNKIWGSKVFLVLCILFIVYITYIMIIQELKNIELEKELAMYQKELDELHVMVEDLADELGKTKDLDYIEKLAREKLKMVKPNEIMYIINEDN